jgi:hypothetical protein
MVDRQSLPKALSPARTSMFLQGFLGIAGSTFFLVMVASFDPGEEGAGLLTVLATISLVIAATLTACAALLPRRLPWVRVTVIAVEGLVTASALIGIAFALAYDSVHPTQMIPLAFSVPVLVTMFRSDARTWFAGGEPGVELSEEKLLP